MAPIHKTVKLAHYFQICSEGKEKQGGGKKRKTNQKDALHKPRELEITITDTSQIIRKGIVIALK